jgi:hypothetical protein
MTYNDHQIPFGGWCFKHPFILIAAGDRARACSNVKERGELLGIVVPALKSRDLVSANVEAVELSTMEARPLVGIDQLNAASLRSPVEMAQTIGVSTITMISKTIGGMCFLLNYKHSRHAVRR